MPEKTVFTSLGASGLFPYFIFLSKDNAASKNSLQESLQFYSAPNIINNFIHQPPSPLQRSQHRYLHLAERKRMQHSFPHRTKPRQTPGLPVASRVLLRHPTHCNAPESYPSAGQQPPPIICHLEVTCVQVPLLTKTRNWCCTHQSSTPFSLLSN